MKKFKLYKLALLAFSIFIASPNFAANSDIETNEQSEKYYIYPDKTKYVVVSNHDINRINCATGIISGIWYAKHKGVSHQLHDTDIVVTYDVRYDTETNKSQYISKEHSMHFKCGNAYYQLRMKPADTPTKIIYARADIKKAPKRNKKTRAVSDKEMMSLMFKKAERGAYRKTEKIMVSNLDIKGSTLTLKNHISSYEGDFIIDVYTVSTDKSLEVTRSDFNVSKFRKDIVAIKLSSNILRVGETITLSLISRRVKN